MGEEKDLLTLLKGRINDQIFNLKTDQILFYAKIDVGIHVSKKNNRPIFRAGQRSFMGKSSKLRNAEDAMVLQLRSQGNQHGILEPIKSDLWALCLFYFENYNLRKKEKRSKKINDLSNLFELPMDCLQTAGIIEDDTQICSFDLSRRLPGMKNELEIFLIEFDNILR
jgi:Holliday junction resolvase RusA-like endonuclease